MFFFFYTMYIFFVNNTNLWLYIKEHNICTWKSGKKIHLRKRIVFIKANPAQQIQTIYFHGHILNKTKPSRLSLKRKRSSESFPSIKNFMEDISNEIPVSILNEGIEIIFNFIYFTEFHKISNTARLKFHQPI